MWIDDISFKHQLCKCNGKESKFCENNIINLYVVLTRKCNANCKFCTFTGNSEEIDLNLFKMRLLELLSVSEISTIHFTGGEPTLELDKLVEMCAMVKRYSPNTLTSVNTNGIYLSKLDGIDVLENISLSRHSYIEKDNRFLMGGIDDLPSDKNILDFKNKHKLHMSCNLVSGYIDSEEQIIKYLEYAHSLGVYDIGIVDLMQVNAFCKGHYVGLDSIPFQSNKQFIQSRFHENIDGCNEVCCRCINWLYRTNDNKGLLSLYYRHAVKSATIADYLVYENNHITQGFSGKMLV